MWQLSLRRFAGQILIRAAAPLLLVDVMEVWIDNETTMTIKKKKKSPIAASEREWTSRTETTMNPLRTLIGGCLVTSFNSRDGLDLTRATRATFDSRTPMAEYIHRNYVSHLHIHCPLLHCLLVIFYT